MKKIVLFICLCFFLSVFASELRIYNDKCVYYPDSPKSFVGFNSNVVVFCDNYKLPLFKGNKVEGVSPLKKLFGKYKDLSFNFAKVSEKKAILEKAVNSLKVSGSMDLAKIFEKSDYFASKLATVKKEERDLNDKVSALVSEINRMAPSVYPYYCNIPKKFNSIKYQFKGIDTKISNKVFFDVNSKRAKVLKQLTLKNSSGIDIKADKIYVLNIYSRRYFSPIDFRPWVVRERVFGTRKMVARKPANETYNMVGDIPAEPSPVEKQAVQTESRVYMLENVNLFSDGLEKNFKIKEGIVGFEKHLVVYPYTDVRVYNEYKFKLPFEVDSHYWEVSVGKKSFSNVKGMFDKDKKFYRIFAGIDYSVLVSRKKDLNFKEEKGFFSKKKVVKDGYELVFKNISDKAKDLNVVDRVPVSVKEDIVVRDVVINGINDYKLGKKGKLSFNLHLKPGDVKKVKVTFVIEYPENQKIWY